MGATSGIGSGAAGPWYRVQAIRADGRRGASAERDYASVLPAALHAAMHRRPFIAGWLSRGGGAPLELITNAGPLPAAAQTGTGTGAEAGLPSAGAAAPSPGNAADRPGGRAVVELLFPGGARGAPMPDDWLADPDRLVWAPGPA